MGFLSIRVLNVVLVVAVVVVVAVLCTTLSLTTAERALSDTRDSRDASVNSAFLAGEQSVKKLTEQYLQQLGESADKQIHSFNGLSHDLMRGLCDEMSNGDRDTVTSWEYLLSKQKLFYYQTVTHSDIDGIGVYTEKKQAMAVVEGSHTLARGEDEYHHYWLNYNNGTDHQESFMRPVEDRTYSGSFYPDGSGEVFGMFTNDSNVDRGCSPTEQGVLTEGRELDAPCYYSYGGHRVDAVLLNYGGTFDQAPLGDVYYSSFVGLGTYTGMIVRCVYGMKATGEKLGMGVSGADLRKISVFLSKIDMGGDRGSLGRVFIAARKSDLYGAVVDQRGLLVGTSHGKYETKIYFFYKHARLRLPSFATKHFHTAR